MDDQLTRLFFDENGATMVEYSIMLGFIALVCIAIVAAVGGSTAGLYNDVNTTWPD